VKRILCGEGVLTSEVKIRANRENALKSTGPKDTGLTRFNALRHGLTAKELTVMPFETPADYEALLEGLRQDFQPHSTIEEILIEQMAQSLWRRQRVVRVEKSEIEADLAMAPLHFDAAEHRKRASARFGGYGKGTEGLDDLVPSFTGDDTDPHLETLKATAEERKKLYVESQLKPSVGPLLLRYESTLERQFYRALIMLTKIRGEKP
jgi:hypothetical protein